MKSVAALLFCCGLAVLAAGSADPKGTKLHLTVPKQVSSDAAARVAGDAHASPPILMLEGVEIGYNEGLTIKVLGPPEPGSDEPTVLAVTGMVGGHEKNPNAPPQKFTLTVPLNDKASQLLEKKNEIDLTLQVEDNESRAPLKLDRAYFATRDSQ
jgi:hypothetical protein